MGHFDMELFLWLNAGAHLPSWLLASALFIARDIVFLLPVYLVGLFIFGTRSEQNSVVFACISTVLVFLMAYGIGHVWPHPRPFMVGLGHQYLPHAANHSFPSDHAAGMWAIGLSLFVMGKKRAGTIICLLTLLVGWARIFLGVHYPSDIIGGIIVASIAVIIVSPLRFKLLDWFPLYLRMKKQSRNAIPNNFKSDT